MRYLIAIAFIMGFCSISYASLSKDKFLTSCNGSFLTAMDEVSPDASLEKQKYYVSFGKDICEKVTDGWDKKGYFANMNEPLFMGCMMGVDIVYSDSMEPNKRKELTQKLQFKICKSIRGK